MHLIFTIAKSFWGVVSFNLPMQIVPHRVGGRSLVAFISSILALLYILAGGLFEGVFFCGCSLYILNIGISENLRPSKPSLNVALLYVLLISEFVVFFVMSLTQSHSGAGSGTNAIEVICRGWQLMVFFIYGRVLRSHHKLLADTML